ncbi:hypothetical protein [Yoonia sp.]|uniref:hypothetical protein n=1 Tax=Yoonia sp. TaxID=2212373 RepID=UPI002FD9CDB1
MRVSRSISHAAQYTALVDILFATIGVFVIVFALQDLDPPQPLQPAPYDHLITCEGQDALGYLGGDGQEAIDLRPADIRSGRLETLLAGGGRVLVALGSGCLIPGDGPAIARQLRDLEETLNDRPATDTSPLILFEFAPLGLDDTGADAIRSLFLTEGRP